MSPHRVVACSLAAGLLAWSGQACAGWVIDQVMKGGGPEGRQQVVVQANRIKTVLLGPDGQPAAAFILDLNAETITQVDYQDRHSVTATIREYAEMIRGAQQAMSEQMGQAMKQMQEAVKDMPPEQRKAVEQMMRSQTPQAAPAPQECRAPKVEVQKTDQQATVAGYPATRYDVQSDGKPESEIWVTTSITAWRELDPKKLEQFTTEMTKAMPRCGPAQGRPGLPMDDPSWKLLNEGYPVRTVILSGGGGTIEVIKAETRTLPASEFQPPAGFARKTLQEAMGR